MSSVFLASWVKSKVLQAQMRLPPANSRFLWSLFRFPTSSPAVFDTQQQQLYIQLPQDIRALYPFSWFNCAQLCLYLWSHYLGLHLNLWRPVSTTAEIITRSFVSWAEGEGGDLASQNCSGNQKMEFYVIYPYRMFRDTSNTTSKTSLFLWTDVQHFLQCHSLLTIFHWWSGKKKDNTRVSVLSSHSWSNTDDSDWDITKPHEALKLFIIITGGQKIPCFLSLSLINKGH